MIRDISKRLLARDESSLSFHATQTIEPRQPIINLNVKLLCAIYVFAQIIQLLIGFHLVQEYNIVTLAAQRCLTTIIISLGYVQFVDQTQYSFDQENTRLVIVISLIQVVASITGLYAMSVFPFSEMCAFHQLTAGYILVITHFLIQPGNILILGISLLQTLSIICFQGTISQIALCLLQPISLSFMAIFRGLMVKQVQQFSLMLYSNLLAVPVYIILMLILGDLHSIFDLSYFIQIIFMCIFQMLAYLAMYELQQGQTQPIHIWALAGIVTLLSLMIQQMFHGVPLDIGTLSIIFIVFSTIGLHK